MTTDDVTPYAAYTDDELLQQVYMAKDLMPSVTLELAVRLEQALAALQDKPKGAGDLALKADMDREQSWQ